MNNFVSNCRRANRPYLFGDFDEQGEHDDDKQVVKDADSSDDDVDDLECKVTDVG